MKITKTDMWVTPVWEIQTDFDEQFNNELLDELGHYCDPEADGGNSNIWNCDTPRVQELKNYTIKIVKAQTYDYIAPTVTDFEFWHARGWLNYHKTGQGIPIHGHGSPKIAMTYYVKAPDNCGDLLLIDPRNGCDWDSGNDGVNGTKFNRIRPVESKLVFFPGFVLHMVEPNQSSQARVSVTSNMGTFDKSTAQAFKNTL
jgi:hypothetical protein